MSKCFNQSVPSLIFRYNQKLVVSWLQIGKSNNVELQCRKNASIGTFHESIARRTSSFFFASYAFVQINITKGLFLQNNAHKCAIKNSAKVSQSSYKSRAVFSHNYFHKSQKSW